MMTATQINTGESMGRTGEESRRHNLPVGLPTGYGVTSADGLIKLHYGGVLLMALLDPVAQRETAKPETTQRAMEADLVRAARHHYEARNLVGEELDQLRRGLHDRAQATSRRRLARRADYYGALEAASSRGNIDAPEGGSRR